MRYFWLVLTLVLLIAAAFGWRHWHNEQARAVLEDIETAILYGDVNAPHVIVEHFDYRCPYCPQMHQIFIEALKTRPDIKLLVRSFPKLGPESELISRYILAAGLQDKAEQKALHETLLVTPAASSPQFTLEAARVLGLDAEKLDADARGDIVNQQLATIMQAAEQFGFRATPTYFMNNIVYVPMNGIPTVEDVRVMLDDVFGPQQ